MNNKNFEVSRYIYQNKFWLEIWPKDGKCPIERYHEKLKPIMTIELGEANLAGIEYMRSFEPKIASNESSIARQSA